MLLFIVQFIHLCITFTLIVGPYITANKKWLSTFIFFYMLIVTLWYIYGHCFCVDIENYIERNEGKGDKGAKDSKDSKDDKHDKEHSNKPAIISTPSTFASGPGSLQNDKKSFMFKMTEKLLGDNGEKTVFYTTSLIPLFNTVVCLVKINM